MAVGTSTLEPGGAESFGNCLKPPGSLWSLRTSWKKERSSLKPASRRSRPRETDNRLGDVVHVDSTHAALSLCKLQPWSERRKEELGSSLSPTRLRSARTLGRVIHRTLPLLFGSQKALRRAGHTEPPRIFPAGHQSPSSAPGKAALLQELAVPEKGKAYGRWAG